MSFFGPNRTRSVTVAFDNASVTNLVLPPPPLPGFVWDAVTSVTVTDSGVATEHPVENGLTDITDNVRTMPRGIAVTGLVTDTPITQSINLINLIQGNVPQLLGGDNAINLYELLLQLRAERRRLVVAGSWFTMASCWCTNVTGTRDTSTGAAISITASFKLIRVARPQIVPAVIDADIQAAGYSAGGSASAQSVDIGEWVGSDFNTL